MHSFNRSLTNVCCVSVFVSVAMIAASPRWLCVLNALSWPCLVCDECIVNVDQALSVKTEVQELFETHAGDLESSYTENERYVYLL